MQRKTLLVVVPIATMWLSGCEQSATEGGSGAEGSAMPAMSGAQQPSGQRAAEHMSEGTLNSVDQAAGTVNISHGPVASASWPGMTMSFKLADPSAAANLRPGQKVDFRFTIESGMSATVTQIAPAE
jgi:Cu(I)/Ag(I) efflux system membrane fusion protein